MRQGPSAANLNLWRTEDCIRVGSYEGVSGVANCFDISRDAEYVVVGSGGSDIAVFELLTGKLVTLFNVQQPVKGIAWAEGTNERVFAVTLQKMRVGGVDQPSSLSFYSFSPAASPPCQLLGEPVGERELNNQFTKVNWLPANRGVIVALTNGTLRSYDPRGNVLVELPSAHKGALNGEDGDITSLSLNATKVLLLTTSRDKTAKLWDVKDFESGTVCRCSRRDLPHCRPTYAKPCPEPIMPLKEYKFDFPMNAGAISIINAPRVPGSTEELPPLVEHVFFGGGIRAQDAALHGGSGGFELRLHHLALTHEIARVKGGFSPTNALAISPDGLTLITGLEEGNIRIYKVRAALPARRGSQGAPEQIKSPPQTPPHTLTQFDADYFELDREDNLEDAELVEALKRGDLETLSKMQEDEESERKEIDQAVVSQRR